MEFESDGLARSMLIVAASPKASPRRSWNRHPATVGPSDQARTEPRDVDHLAKAIAAEATSEDQPEAPAADTRTTNGKNPAAVALGRLGGKKGGPAQAKKLSNKWWEEIARRAAEARRHEQIVTPLASHHRPPL